MTSESFQVEDDSDWNVDYAAERDAKAEKNASEKADLLLLLFLCYHARCQDHAHCWNISICDWEEDEIEQAEPVSLE